MDNKKLVNNIKMLCDIRGISVSQLEKYLELSPGLISRWSKTTPSLDRLLDIAKFFETSIDNIIGGEFESTENEKNDKIIKLIDILYQETQKSQLNWEILDVNKLPIKLNQSIRQEYHDGKSQYYYAPYENGYFIVGLLYAVERHAPIGMNDELKSYVLCWLATRSHRNDTYLSALTTRCRSFI